MKENKKQIFPIHFSPGKKLFHIVVRLSDAPGSYSSILDLVSKKVNFVGTNTYSLGVGTAMFSGFSEALSPDQTAKGLKDLILQSRAAQDAEVYEGKDGLLVDTFHSGLAVGEEAYIMIRQEGIDHMFDEIVRFFGSGGDSLLYQNGVAIGKKNAELTIGTVGMERVRTQTGNLYRFLTAQGWGAFVAAGDLFKGTTTITVEGCFECATGRGSRKGCNFLRGYLDGAASVALGRDARCVETRCTLRGAKACEFTLGPTS
jgi:predicted hydrocarbon binding protein